LMLSEAEFTLRKRSDVIRSWKIILLDMLSGWDFNALWCESWNSINKINSIKL